MGVNMEIPQEVRYALSKVISSLPYYSTNGYVDSCDQGIALAVQGLKTLNSNQQYRVNIMQVLNGYVFNIPFDTIGQLMNITLGDSSFIDDKWVYTGQLREESEKNRLKQDITGTVQHISVMAYVRNIVEKAQELASFDLDNIAVIVSSLAACLMENGGQYNDQALQYLSGVTQQFNQLLINQRIKDNRFNEMFMTWWNTCKQYYDYMPPTCDFYRRLKLSNDGTSYIMTIAVAGLTQQTETRHRNIPYALYGVSLPGLISFLGQFKYPFARISVIKQTGDTAAYDIETLDNQGRSVVKECAEICDSGNGVLLRLMITPNRKTVV